VYKFFLDETGDHSLKIIDPQYPIFILVSCIFEEEYYNKHVISKINHFKVKYFGDTDVILHSYDIRKQKGPFKILTKTKTRITFYKDLNNLIGSFDFSIIASVIMKSELKKIKDKLKNISKDPYEICFEFLLERFVMFMQRMRDQGDMSFESRDDSSNMRLLNLYESFKKHGSSRIGHTDIKKRIAAISFPSKSANIIGHQISDLIAYAIARFVLHPERENKLYGMIHHKFVRGKYNKLVGCGLKVFPKSDVIFKIIKGPRIS
jgi:hypothetical protein